jgi:hypothetical protein
MVQHYQLPLGIGDINILTTAQNLSSNLLDVSPLNSAAQTTNVFSSYAGSQITSIGYQKNACLRAPGASCNACSCWCWQALAC